MELEAMGLLQALDALRRGRCTSEDLVRACLSRVNQAEAQIKAWEWLDPDAALLAARKADARMRQGGQPGLLHGLPIGVKDIMATAGVPTRMGSPIHASHVPRVSATVVRRLQDAGGLVMGKTVTTEFAWRNPGKTHNPWNLGHTPGGSSSGSAAAVAAGMVPAALGTQTVGSVIRPAAYCGVVGYKPSFGLISRAGVHPLSHSLDHVGVFARSVADAAYLVACLAGQDDLDPGSLAAAVLHPGEAAAADLPAGERRLAAVRTPVWRLADEAQRAMWDANLAALGRAGAVVEDVELPTSFQDALDVLRTILMAEGAQIYAPLRAANPGKTSAALDDLIETGLKVSSVDYTAALAAAKGMRAELRALLSRFDAIVTPPATGEAPPTLVDTGDASFCGIWTLMGVPAVTFPVGRGPTGLPLGLQVVGAYLDDRKTLDVAAWCSRQIGTGCGLAPPPKETFPAVV
ncbi:Amidase [Thiomonas sp. X19]|uniref:amidase n=1 Tax=Thiomonas sp. X19 TaxID=1050370 RepID=UPI000B75AB5D|nr:amidase [Thiomonas sp. X19]SCC91180.1 Amidase [Thiomonas sp. X19]